jgi:myosin-1
MSFRAISKKRPVTAGTQFRQALAELVTKLLACRPYYIRCIKPNEKCALSPTKS